jgi:hypothetical protein
MGYILETDGPKGKVWHWKFYSTVDGKGKPLAKLGKDGKPLRVQQSVLLAKKDETFTSKTCW